MCVHDLYGRCYEEVSAPSCLQDSASARVDHRKRRDIGEWVENKIALDPAFKSKILYSDEARFWTTRLWKSTRMAHRL